MEAVLGSTGSGLVPGRGYLRVDVRVLAGARAHLAIILVGTGLAGLWLLQRRCERAVACS